MRHRCGNDKLGRSSEDRIALLRSGTQALFQRGKIKTTLARAKNLRKFADKFITLAKKGDLSSRRRAISLVNDKKVVH
ncbi:MAG: bL17 family ribosomal protein, partial [bacterium]